MVRGQFERLNTFFGQPKQVTHSVHSKQSTTVCRRKRNVCFRNTIEDWEVQNREARRPRSEEGGRIAEVTNDQEGEDKPFLVRGKLLQLTLRLLF